MSAQDGSTAAVSAEFLVAQGQQFYEGDPGTRNYQKAFALFSCASGLSSADAGAWLGDVYLHGRRVQADLAKAKSMISYAAAANSPVGLRFMGVPYQNGLMGAQDYSMARGYYTKAGAYIGRTVPRAHTQ